MGQWIGIGEDTHTRLVFKPTPRPLFLSIFGYFPALGQLVGCKTGSYTVFFATH